MSLVSLAWNLVPFPLSVNQSVVGGGWGGWDDPEGQGDAPTICWGNSQRRGTREPPRVCIFKSAVTSFLGHFLWYF